MQHTYQKLLTYAYNIVGSYDDAKDLVQDVIEKYITIDKSTIRDESNFLIKSTINHSLNFKKRQSKKDVFGEWLPEPVSFDHADTPLIKHQPAAYTMLVLLETLTPKERAVFILKEGFSYAHADIAELLDISVDNSRQLLSRATKQVSGIKFFNDTTPSTIHTDVLKKYQTALYNANLHDLEKLLVDDIKLMADGGKNVRVVKGIEVGRVAVAHLLGFVQQQFLSDTTFSFHNLNHQPTICFWRNETLYNCHILSLDNEGHIQQIYSIVDHKKLKNLF